MTCPKCGGSTTVRDTRYDEKENEVFRRRACKICGADFFTIEFDIESNDKLASIWKTLIRGSGGSRENGRTNNE